MAKTVVMPQMGYDMDAGTLLRWLKQEGEQVERGEPIAEIETDKVNLEIESFEGGIVRKLLVTEGQTVPVGEPIAIIGEPGEAIETPPEPTRTEPTVPAAGPPAMPAQSVDGLREAPAPLPEDQVIERAPGERVRASPLVRRLAAEHGIDLQGVHGTGPGGRIVKEDIMPLVGRPQPVPATARPAPAAPAAAPTPLPTPPTPGPAPAPAAAPAAALAGQPLSELHDLSRMRKTIARRMGESWQQAPHFYVTMAIDMARALELRTQINEQVEDPQKVSVNDLIVKGAALALRKFPSLNASFAGEQLRVYDRIDVGVAVAIEGGLISPVIPDTDHKPLGEIAAMAKDLIERARNGGLKPEEYQGGTFTVSNLGMYGVENFIAVINPPQAAILAIGAIRTVPVFVDDAFVPAQRMEVTLSADHRVTDGAEVARYLIELKRLLENPMLLAVS